MSVAFFVLLLCLAERRGERACLEQESMEPLVGEKESRRKNLELLCELVVLATWSWPKNGRVVELAEEKEELL